jgi:hypothetical protein
MSHGLLNGGQGKGKGVLRIIDGQPAFTTLTLKPQTAAANALTLMQKGG